MKFATKKIAAAVALAALASAAQAAPVVDLTVTSGTFEMPTVTMAPVAFGDFGWDLVDGYGQNDNLFSFFGGPVGIFTGDGTAATTPTSPTPPFGGTPVAGGAVPTGDVTGSTITMDLSAFTAAWNGTNFNQGASNVVGTWDSNTNTFTASWQSTISGGAFDGKTGIWTVTGLAAPVPEASTYGMMLAGLGLVGFAVRRRKLVA